MPQFDISQAADFSQITQGALQNLGALFGARDPREWDITEASFRGVKFLVFKLSGRDVDITAEDLEAGRTNWQGAVDEIRDYGGRRKAIVKFPYVDGQTTDDMGRKGNSFHFNVLIFGIRYKEGYQALINALDQSGPGRLIHPVRGVIDCVNTDIVHLHKSEARKAVALQLIFEEHNFSIGQVNNFVTPNIKSALSQALDVFRIIDRALTKIEQAQLLIRGIKNLINSYLAVYKRDEARVLSRMNTTFNTRGGSADIPSLLPQNLGGTGTATSGRGDPSPGTVIVPSNSSSEAIQAAATANAALLSGSSNAVSSDNFVVVRSVSDPFNGVPVADLSPAVTQSLAVAELTRDVQALRNLVTLVIQTIQAQGTMATLEQDETINELRQSIVLTQSVLEIGAKSSSARVIEYRVPRLMSLREACFENGLSPNRMQELDLLNSALLSTNFIEEGYVLKVPVA